MTNANEETHWTRKIGKFWALHDELRVVDAAALVAGIEPTAVYWQELEPGVSQPKPGAIDGNRSDEGIREIETVLSAITNAIRSGKLPATLRYSAREHGYVDAMADIDAQELEPFGGFPLRGTTAEEDEEFYESGKNSFFYKPFPDWFETTVARDDLVAWLESRRFPVPFFGTEADAEPAYLNPEHPRYSAKLAAAVRVWEALEDEDLIGPKTPKAAATDWLESRYSELGLVWENPETGKRAMNREGIKQIVAVVNWKTKGGATPTPASD